jgi:hypothetical protein
VAVRRCVALSRYALDGLIPRRLRGISPSRLSVVALSERQCLCRTMPDFVFRQSSFGPSC